MKAVGSIPYLSSCIIYPPPWTWFTPLAYLHRDHITFLAAKAVAAGSNALVTAGTRRHGSRNFRRAIAVPGVPIVPCHRWHEKQHRGAFVHKFCFGEESCVARSRGSAKQRRLDFGLVSFEGGSPLTAPRSALSFPRHSPTNPTQSPTQSPMGPLPEDESNHMFCGNDWAQTGASCSLETHCKNGRTDCLSFQSCWSGVPCDVRSFIPYEEGGWLGQPSHQELAASMGLRYPSDDVSSAALYARTTSPFGREPLCFSVRRRLDPSLIPARFPSSTPNAAHRSLLLRHDVRPRRRGLRPAVPWPRSGLRPQRVLLGGHALRCAGAAGLRGHRGADGAQDSRARPQALRQFRI